MKTMYSLLLLIMVTSCGVQNKSSEPTTVIPTKPTVLTPNMGYDSIGGNFHTGLQDRKGNIWFGTTGAGVYRYSGDSIIRYTTADGLPSNMVWYVMEDKAGIIWFGTQNGLCKYDGTKFTAVNIINFVSPTHMPIFSLMQDRAGTIWVGCQNEGIYTYDGKTFTRFFDDTTIIKNNKSTHLKDTQWMVEDKDGNIWFCSWAREGVTRYDGKTLYNFTATEGLTDPMVHSILEDSKGNMWFGSRNTGVFRFEDGKFTNVTAQTGLRTSVIYAMLEDRNGHIWFTTEPRGAWRYDGKEFKQFSTPEGLGNPAVFSITEDTEGNLWFGTRNMALYRFDGKTFTHVVEKGVVL